MIKILCLFCVIFFLFSLPASAQTGISPDRDKALEITADERLVWHRNALYFKAIKNVRAVQGKTTLLSDVLTAKYRDGTANKIEIHTIQADGHVRLIATQGTAYGDKAIYNVDKEYAVMTGGNLRLVSEEQVVTARDMFQYWVREGRLEAIGRAVVVRNGDTLEADKIIVIFSEDSKGQRALKTLEALGHVKITTPTEILTGDRALYQAETNVAALYDNVKITRGLNVLEGARAHVDLETNISQIFGGAEGTGTRVRGVFYPGSEKLDGE